MYRDIDIDNVLDIDTDTDIDIDKQFRGSKFLDTANTWQGLYPDMSWEIAMVKTNQWSSWAM